MLLFVFVVQIQAEAKKSTQTIHRTKFRRTKDDADEEEETRGESSTLNPES